MLGTQQAGAAAFLTPGCVFILLAEQVDVVAGQKTGFFLDQRENRALVGRLSARTPDLPHGRSVLNCFGYTGGFSCYAGR